MENEKASEALGRTRCLPSRSLIEEIRIIVLHLPLIDLTDHSWLDAYVCWHVFIFHSSALHSDFLVKIVEASDSSQQKTFRGHEAPVLSVAFDPKDAFLVGDDPDCDRKETYPLSVGGWVQNNLNVTQFFFIRSDYCMNTIKSPTSWCPALLWKVRIQRQVRNVQYVLFSADATYVQLKVKKGWGVINNK